MGIRMAEDADRATLMALWRTVFSEDEGFLQDFFRLRYARATCLLWAEKEKPVAALYAFPVTLFLPTGNQKALYLAGLSTAAPFRGRGCMTALLAALRQAWPALPFVLFPAAGKRDFYAARGFSSCGAQRIFPLPAAEQNEPRKEERYPVGVPLLHSLYTLQLQQTGGGILRDEISWHFLLSEAQSVRTDGAYALIQGKTATETAAADLPAAKRLLALLQKCGVTSIAARPRSAMAAALDEDTGIAAPAGMIALPDDKIKIPAGFLIDELY